LIDSSTSTKYKNVITFYNRETGTYDSFYINIRNTSLPATLTSSQSREYIQFAQPSDTLLNDKSTPQTFVTSLTIKADDELIFDASNRLGLAQIWKSKQNSNVTVTVDSTFALITFEINSSLGFSANTRIVYEYTDNYGTSYKEIHLYKETIITNEVSSENDLYAYYNTNGTLYYITKDGFIYSYNPGKYVVSVFDYKDGELSSGCENASVVSDAGSISTITLYTTRTGVDTTKTDVAYNDYFAIEVRDVGDLSNLVKTIYVELYNELPIANTSATDNNTEGHYKLLDASRNNVTSTILGKQDSESAGYFSEITLLYSEKSTFIPIKYSISTDGKTWESVSSGTVLKNQTDELMTYYLKIWYDETYMTNELKNSTYLFEYVPSSQIIRFSLSSLTSTFWVEKTINNVTTIVEKSDSIYYVKDSNNKIIAQYSNHYIIRDDAAVEIKTNEEQGIEVKDGQIYTPNGITTKIYLITNIIDGKDLGNIPAFKTYIAISYIPASENFVDEFYTYSNTNGIINNTENSENLISVTSKKFVVSQDYSNLNKIELKWSKFYGIEQNEILITLVKDGVSLNPTVYSKKEDNKSYNYIYLTASGKIHNLA
jgi:hypothetical protein